MRTANWLDGESRLPTRNESGTPYFLSWIK